MATEGLPARPGPLGNKGRIDARVIGDRAWLRFDAPDNLRKAVQTALLELWRAPSTYTLTRDALLFFVCALSPGVFFFFFAQDRFL